MKDFYDMKVYDESGQEAETVEYLSKASALAIEKVFERLNIQVQFKHYEKSENGVENYVPGGLR